MQSQSHCLRSRFHVPRRRFGNVKAYTGIDRFGHFAGLTVPKELFAPTRCSPAWSRESILSDITIRPARAVGWRIGRRLRRNRSGRIFGRDWRFLSLLPLGRRPNRLKVSMHWVGDKPRKFETHRDSLRLIALVCERRRKFRDVERELTRRATALP